MLSVLYICSSITSRGIHHYAAMLPQAMHDLGIHVRIVSSPGEADPGVRQRLREKGIEVIDFPRPERRGLLSTWESASFLSCVFHDYPVDIVHVFGFAHACRCWLAQRMFLPRREVPIIVSLEALRHGKPEELLARIIASQVFNRMPSVVCTLSSTELQKMQQAGLRRSKLKLIPNWIDWEQFERDARQYENARLPFELEENVVIVYLAQFIPRKGHADLLQAASQVIEAHPKCVFVLAGEGPILPKMRSLAINLGLNNHVLFPGRLPIEQVPTLLCRAHIGVVASLAETFGWTIVEPLLADIPVVTTDVGFAADLAAAGGVLMVPNRNPRALAEAMIKLIENPALRHEIAQRGKAFVLENCEIRQVARQYLEIYQECLR